MSYSTWTVNGYGIDMGDINYDDLNFDKIRNLFETTDQAKKWFRDFVYAFIKESAEINAAYEKALIDDTSIDLGAERQKYEIAFKILKKHANFDDFLEYGEGECGERELAYLLKKAMEFGDADVRIEYADDFDNNQFLLILPHYSWDQLSDRERGMTKEQDVNALFHKYIRILTDKPVYCSYYSVENGG